jgi:hypothetical protein
MRLRNSLLSAVLSMSNVFGVDPLKPKQKRAKQTKTCLACGKTHKHNNSFCSPDCCKLYTERKGPSVLREHRQNTIRAWVNRNKNIPKNKKTKVIRQKLTYLKREISCDEQ